MLLTGRWNLLASLLAFAGCGSPDVPGDHLDQAAADVEASAIQEVVELTYRVSSFEDAGTADPEAFRTPFTPTATLSFTRGGELMELSVDEYVELRRGLLESGEVQSLDEWEIVGKTDHFGDIAHRMSSYAVRINGSDELAERGMMSFQLMKIGGQWKVHSLTWHTESAETPLPARYTSPVAVDG